MARRFPVNLGAILDGVPAMCVPQDGHFQWGTAVGYFYGLRDLWMLHALENLTK